MKVGRFYTKKKRLPSLKTSWTKILTFSRHGFTFTRMCQYVVRMFRRVCQQPYGALAVIKMVMSTTHRWVCELGRVRVPHAQKPFSSRLGSCSICFILRPNCFYITGSRGGRRRSWEPGEDGKLHRVLYHLCVSAVSIPGPLTFYRHLNPLHQDLLPHPAQGQHIQTYLLTKPTALS